MTIKVGDKVTYISYGEEKTATVTRLSRDGSIIFLDNGRFVFHRSIFKKPE